MSNPSFFTSDCDTAIKDAKADQAKQTLKYYVFGIASLPLNQTDQLYETYGIEVVSLGCMVDTALVCYNQYVDELLMKRTGKDFYGLLGGL